MLPLVVNKLNQLRKAAGLLCQRDRPFERLVARLKRGKPSPRPTRGYLRRVTLRGDLKLASVSKPVWAHICYIWRMLEGGVCCKLLSEQGTVVYKRSYRLYRIELSLLVPSTG